MARNLTTEEAEKLDVMILDFYISHGGAWIADRLGVTRKRVYNRAAVLGIKCGRALAAAHGAGGPTYSRVPPDLDGRIATMRRLKREYAERGIFRVQISQRDFERECLRGAD